VQDIKHQIVAVASSSSAQQAVTFCKEIQIPEASQVSTHGSYAELVADPEVAIVYVATPASHHFQNVMLALTAGKHVLCEKPFTLTRAQAQSLVENATQRQLFLMEAVWTRFFPISEKVQELVSAGAIGAVCRVIGKLPYGPKGLETNLDPTIQRSARILL
jgi:predicted dehydrogenase